MKIDNIDTMIHGDIHCEVYAESYFKKSGSTPKKTDIICCMPTKTFRCMPKGAIVEMFFFISTIPLLVLWEIVVYYQVEHHHYGYIPVGIIALVTFMIYAASMWYRANTRCYGAFLTISPENRQIISSKGCVKFDNIRCIKYFSEDRTRRTIKVYAWDDVKPKIFPMPTRHDAAYIYDAITTAVPSLKC